MEKVPIIDGSVTSISKKLKWKKEYIALAGVTIPFVLIFLGGGANFIVDLLAYLYPAYASVRAIETDDTDDDTQWLTYWLVFSLFKMLEGVAESVLQYIPLYMVAKCSFLMWCFHPSFNGATVCYDNLIRPYIMPLLGQRVDAKGSKKDN